MPARLALALLAICMSVAGIPPTPAAAASPTTFFAFNSVGSFVGKTQDLFITPNTGGVGIVNGATTDYIEIFASQEDDDGLTDHWRLVLRPETGGALAVGVYPNAQRFRTTGVPGLDLSGAGDGCNTSNGAFEIHEMAWNGPTLYRLALTYEFRCGAEEGRGLVAGRIRIGSAVALPGIQSPTESREMASIIAGGIGVPRTYTLAVGEDLPVSFGTLAFEGTNAASFVLSADDCSGATLDPGQSCTFDVAFAPQASGGQLGWLNIPHDGGLSPRRLPYWGIGLIPTTTEVIGVEPATEHPEDGLRYVFRVTPNPGGNTAECVIDGVIALGSPSWPGGVGYCYGPRTIGTRTVTARYLESFQHATSEMSAPVSFTVSNVTTTTIAASRTTAAPGESITFTSTVSTASNLLYPGGQLVLRDGASGPILASRPITRASPTLTFTTTSLAAGTHTIVAAYSGLSGSLQASSAQISVVIASPPPPPPPPPPDPDPVVRIGGSDRYATAAAISARSFDPGVPAVYVATGLGFADALAAGPLAARRGAPVLLVSTTSVPAPTLTELQRLKPARIYVLGGTAVVSPAVASKLASVAPVTRIGGANRYETAARLAASFSPGVPVAYVATGASFPDALAGVPAAAHGKGPLLLVAPDGIPGPTAAELDRLNPKKIVILGGSAVVSPAIAGALDRYTTGLVDRMAGSNRYSTAVKVSTATFAQSDIAYLAVGTNYPDALAGGPVAGMQSAPILLVERDTVPTIVRDELQRLNVTRVVILGGTGSISTTVETQLTNLLGS
jgi:putative cell wall-binding protein